MLILQKDPKLFLVELSDLRQDPPPERIADSLDPLRRIVAWAEEYLCRPHPELGREGPVCPYVQVAMKKGLFYLAVCRGRDFDRDGIEGTLVRYRDWFLDLEPRQEADAAFKTILILFPDLLPEDVPGLVDATQERLKPIYVEKGLMIGEFHAGPPKKAGLWNPDFLPLRSPVPMLVIRNMVPTDFAFLRGDKGLVEAYLACHGERIPAHLREEVRQVVEGFGIPFGGTEALEVVHPRVREILERNQVPVRVHRHANQPIPIRGPRDFAHALGYDIGRITKSLFVRCNCHESYAVLVCPVHERVDLRRLAEHLGCTRLELASLPELEALLGFSPGGVSPIGAGDVRVLLDEQLFEHSTVLVAAGEVAVEIEIGPRRLAEITQASVMAMTLGASSEAGASA
ncbi:MAG TPA: YbaK/EbsC family protein [Thermoanaerobaculia bacterium]|jgi:Cys-tRNA(Pro) deacylase|nr:YbaK/EbsC family protein [Thermoanaerobaculia bacterium]